MKLTPKDRANLAEAALFETQRQGEEIDNAHKKLALEEFERKVSLYRSVDVNNRIYDFSETITPETVGVAIATFSAWKRQSTAPMTVIFNSPGGAIVDGLNLFDYIRSFTAKDEKGQPLGPDAIDPDSQRTKPAARGVYVTTIAMGIAASMAAVLIQAGNRRVVAPNAYLSIHEASSQFSGRLSDIQDEAKFVVRLNDRLIGILSGRSKITPEEVRSMMERKDVYLDADETLSLGLADAQGYA